MNYKAEQETFWAGDFGDDYIARNTSNQYLASNLSLFSKAFGLLQKPASLVEFGANVGMNLRALQLLFPGIELFGVEINEKAAIKLAGVIGANSVFTGSILDFTPKATFDIAMTKGLLIHINPDMLGDVYDKLYAASNKYIFICEYYNPTPVSVSYRGHQGYLYKRDFAGEMLDRFADLPLMDYGFCYRRDPVFPQDDATWFVLEKG